MQIVEDLKKFDSNQPISIAIGKFDGIHKGHRELITSTLKEGHTKSGIITFDINPRQFLSAFAPKLITEPKEKEAILRHIGLDYLFMLPFEDLVNLSPIEFLTLIKGNINLKKIVVGSDFTFGREKSGNVDFLRRFCNSNGIELKIIDQIFKDSLRISSTVIRKLIFRGKIKEVRGFLTVPYSICGTVVKGKQLGRTISFPTLNVMPPQKILPANGVYITATVVDGHPLPSITNIGYNPTVDKKNRIIIETHILGEKLADMYGKYINVYFFDKIRDEIKFPSTDKLIERMTEDREIALQFWKFNEMPSLPVVHP